MRLAQSTGTLGSIADRVFGSRPEGMAKDDRLDTTGDLSAIDSEIASLRGEIGAIEDRVDRFSGL